MNSNQPPFAIPYIGFAAYSGTGKTTLLEKLIPELKKRGIRLAVIKHAHHQFDIDKPGKDSHRLRTAGAQQMLIASNKRWALMYEEIDEKPEPVLSELLMQLDTKALDLVLVEGFKHEDFPKIELHRPSVGKPLIYPDDAGVIAFASDDSDIQLPARLTRLDINNIEGLAEFLIDWLDKQSLSNNR